MGQLDAVRVELQQIDMETKEWSVIEVKAGKAGMGLETELLGKNAKSRQAQPFGKSNPRRIW